MNAVDEILFTASDHLDEIIKVKASGDVLELVNCQKDLMVAILVKDRELLTHALGKAIDLLDSWESDK